MDSRTTLTGHLRQLACLYHVQTAYYDMDHRRQQASVESILAVLQALGAPLHSLDEVIPALREKRLAERRRVLEPVTIVRDGERPSIRVCLPAKSAHHLLEGSLEMESGERRVFQCPADALEIIGKSGAEGSDYLVRELALPESLPRGYHSLYLNIAGKTAQTLIISAPLRAYAPGGKGDNRSWGIFVPPYALQAKNGQGSGDYSTLKALSGMVAEKGGRALGTLPLLPTFLDEPFEPSPYSPVSRLLWNELYIDVDDVPEMTDCAEAQALRKELRPEVQALQNAPLVDYQRVSQLKRRILEACCRYLLRQKNGRLEEFQAFLRHNPVVEDYARFRAAMEKRGSTWPSWPASMRDGSLRQDDYDEDTRNTYAYMQWQAHRQVESLAESARRKDVTLYFDLPLGAHPQGYDTWRERDSFAPDATAGAPPDPVYSHGQDWRFPPLHPEKTRERGYRHFIAYIHHHLQHAGMLRIDHVMGLHRLFWIPAGMEARHGVYVRYHAEELYAILALESHRHGSIIVGEDLGTVPGYVRPAMSRHGLRRMYVLHYELACDLPGGLRQPPRDSVASLNTHDMPPFASFWGGLDIPERLKLGLLNARSAREEKRERQKIKSALATSLRRSGWLSGKEEEVRTVLEACLAFLGASRARSVLVNLEDLWLETEAQNVPGTAEDNPNWCRKARYSLEELCRLPEVRDTLKEINRLRKQKRK